MIPRFVIKLFERFTSYDPSLIDSMAEKEMESLRVTNALERELMARKRARH